MNIINKWLCFIILQGLCLASISALIGHGFIKTGSKHCANRLVKNLLSADDCLNFAFTVNTEICSSIPVIRWDIRKQFQWDRHFKISLYVINIIDDDMEEILREMEEKDCLYPRATFVIIADDVNTEVFRALSRYFIVSVLIITDREDIYTYSPYLHENVHDPFLGYYQSNCNDTEDVVDKFIHTDKYPKKWKNATIQTLFIDIPPYIITDQGYLKNSTNMAGMEIEIYKTAIERLGFSVNFTHHADNDWGLKQNGSYTGGLGELQRRKTDAMMGACNAYKTEHLDFDITASYFIDTVNWMVSRKDAEFSWTKYTKIFDKKSWLLILCALISIGISLYIKTGNIHLSISTIVQISLENGVNNFSRAFKDVRIILVLFILGSLVISTLLKNQLFVILSSQKMRNSIESFDDLLNSDFRIVLPHRMTSFLKHTIDPREQQVLSKLHPTNDWMVEEYINAVALGNSATVTVKNFVLYLFTLNFTDHQGNPMIHILNEPSYNLVVQMFFVRGYPIKDAISTCISHNLENGLVAKYKRDTAFDITKDIYRRKIYVFGAHKLGYQDLKWFFYILGFGYALSTLTFCIELLVYKLLNATKNKGTEA